MGQVLYLDFEEGDLSDFDVGTINSSDMAVNGTAAMVGSYGLDITLDGNQNATVGLASLSVSTNTLRFRVYYDISNLSFGSGDSYRGIIRIRTDGTYLARTVLLDFIVGESGGNKYIVCSTKDDANNDNDTSQETLSDAEHYIEVLLTRETADGNNDGTLTLWVDGNQASTNPSSIDNFNLFPTLYQIYVGAYTGLDATTTGHIYIDDIIFRDDDTEIGPAGGPETLSVTITKDTTYKQGVRIYP